MINWGDFLSLLASPLDYMNWRDGLDILLVSFIFYRLILLVRGTRAVPVLYGLVLVAVLYHAAGELGLTTLHWLLTNFLGSIFLVIIIIFQADIRKGLAEIGAGGFWNSGGDLKESALDEVVEALALMARQRIGALVVIEKSMPLGDVIGRGVAIDGAISSELLMTIFFPDTPLHDGAVIISGGRIVAAGCILPLTTDPQLATMYGTRHRAAIGMSEETDALVLVVSEERGSLAMAVGGKLVDSLDAPRMKREIRNAWKG